MVAVFLTLMSGALLGVSWIPGSHSSTCVCAGWIWAACVCPYVETIHYPETFCCRELGRSYDMEEGEQACLTVNKTMKYTLCEPEFLGTYQQLLIPCHLFFIHGTAGLWIDNLSL